tara:strand:+ start:919 stop:1116 length:198 start_codon:yes stop_codon:yes gene_type:complete
MKTWKVLYSYCRVGDMVWNGGPLYTGEVVMKGFTYEGVRVDLRGKLAKDGFNLYRFIANELEETK